MNSYRWQLYIGVGVLVVYLLLLLGSAVQYIRRANRRWLQAHVDAAETRLAATPVLPGESPVVRPAITAALAAARNVLLPKKAGGSDTGAPFWDWIGSREIAGWVRLHEAQRLEVALLSDVEVRARFARAMGQIDELPAARQTAWARVWSELQTPAADGRPSPPDRWRAELSQLLAELFNARDSTYNQLVGLYGKAGLLVAATYLPVTALLVAGYGPVLLAGLIGGLLSRLQRLVYAQDRPTSYGTSWVPLFLAPLLGALAAWSGLHLLALLDALGVTSVAGKLGGFRLGVSNAVLGLAVLFGLSERLLNRVGDQAEKVIAGDRDAKPSAVTGPGTTGVTPPSSEPSGGADQNGVARPAPVPANQPAGQPADQDANQPAVQDANQPAVQDANQPAVQDANQLATQDANQPAVQDEEHGVEHGVEHGA